MPTPILDIQHATIFQDQNMVLQDVSLRLEKGTFTYLIGKTGSGKSSLMKTLYGEILLKQGSGHIVGINLVGLKEADIPFLRRKIGIVFQDFKLLPDRSVLNNLLFVLKATGWTDTLRMEEKANDVLDKVGMKTKGFKYPHELSGGEQQRIAIARALLNDPELILADEPTGNLDTENSIMISDILFKYVKEEGSSLIMVTHDPKLANKAKRKIKIKDGKIK